MTYHQLVRGLDGGGGRWYLDGRPVHCGAGLVLRIEQAGGAVDVRVRFETDDGHPLLYLQVAPSPDPDAGIPSPQLVCRVDRFTLPRLRLRWPV